MEQKIDEMNGIGQKLMRVILVRVESPIGTTLKNKEKIGGKLRKREKFILAEPITIGTPVKKFRKLHLNTKVIDATSTARSFSVGDEGELYLYTDNSKYRVKFA